jgi:hypothetical protein
MFRDTLILVVVLLILITIVSAFGGSIRHTPTISPEGFYGEVTVDDEDAAAQGAQGGQGAGTKRTEGTKSTRVREGAGLANEDAEAAAAAAMAAAGMTAESVEPVMSVSPIEEDDGADAPASMKVGGDRRVEAFQSGGGTFATW